MQAGETPEQAARHETIEEAEAKELIRRGEIRDGFSLSALLWTFASL